MSTTGGSLETDTILSIVSLIFTVVAMLITYLIGRLQLHAARRQLHQAQNNNADLRQLTQLVNRIMIRL